jgi:hypothetical protein
VSPERLEKKGQPGPTAGTRINLVLFAAVSSVSPVDFVNRSTSPKYAVRKIKTKYPVGLKPYLK